MYVIEFFDMSNKIRVKSGSRQPQAWLVNHGGAAKAGGLELVSKELNHFGVIAGLFRQIGGHSKVHIF